MIVIDEMVNAGANRFLKLAEKAENAEIDAEEIIANEKQVMDEEIKDLESTADARILRIQIGIECCCTLERL